MSYSKKKLAELLQTILSNTQLDVSDSTKTRRYMILGGAGSGIIITSKEGPSFHGQVPDDAPPTLYIVNEGCDALDEFVGECMRDDELEHLVGREGVQKHLQSLIIELKLDASLSADMEGLVRERMLKPLRSGIVNWQVTVPCANFRLEQPIRIGNVDFMSREDGYLTNVDLIMSRKGGGDIERQKKDKFAIVGLVNDANSMATSWASVKIRAHSARMSTIAATEVESAINVIRAFIHIFYPRSLNCAFGLPFDIAGATTVFFGNTENGDVSIQWDRRGTLAPIELKVSMIERLRSDFCLAVLSNICATPANERTTLQQAIFVANHWLGRSITALTREDALTCCTIAIERVLIVDGEDTTVERFADRLTYLLSDEPEQRRLIHRIAKRLYDLRSRVVHAGFVGVSEEDGAQMETFGILALVHAAQLSNQMKTHEEFRDCLHDRKLA